MFLPPGGADEEGGRCRAAYRSWTVGERADELVLRWDFLFCKNLQQNSNTFKIIVIAIITIIII